MGIRNARCKHERVQGENLRRDKTGRCLPCRTDERKRRRQSRDNRVESYRVKSKTRNRRYQHSDIKRQDAKWLRRKQIANQRRELRLSNAYREPYDYKEVVFGATHCGICGDKYRKSDRRSLDHKIPISRGGADAPWNVQSAHPRCNFRKGNKIIPTTIVGEA